MGLTISKRNTQSDVKQKKPITQSSSAEVPNEIITEIFSRLPARSVARFRCISKKWAYVLSCPYFTDQLYITNTSARPPRLLFTFHVDDRWLFFSSSRPQNPNENSSSLVAYPHMCFPCSFEFFEICPPVYGLLSNSDKNLMICNPSTGDYIILPNTTTTSWGTKNKNTFVGYDPIEKQFKVLCVPLTISYQIQKHQVLTLEKGKLLWRMVECSIRHIPKCVGICINGILFYKAMNEDSDQPMIVCFEVRSEKFKFIMSNEVVQFNFLLATLINYKGKLGALVNDTDGMFNRRTTCIELWVLDDVEEEKWSSHFYILPPLWKIVVANYWLYTVGMTCIESIDITRFI